MNELKKLPTGLSKLENLRKLYLQGNYNTYIPDSIRNLKNLENDTYPIKRRTKKEEYYNKK